MPIYTRNGTSPGLDAGHAPARMAHIVKLVSWNVNGLRSVLKKGFLAFVEAEQPDMICLQETRCPHDVLEPMWLMDYHPIWNVADKKGYSGTAIFTKVRPHGVALGIDLEEHGTEGRAVTAEYERSIW